VLSSAFFEGDEAEAATCRLADRLIAAMAGPLTVVGWRVTIGLSVGIATARKVGLLLASKAIESA
jgi:hypothetical protein